MKFTDCILSECKIFDFECNVCPHFDKDGRFIGGIDILHTSNSRDSSTGRVTSFIFPHSVES